MNAAIEFHDSVIGELTRDGKNARVVFAPAYLHRSEGDAGVHAGTGWQQYAVLVIRDAEIEGERPSAAAALSDGGLVVGGRRNALLSLPFNTSEVVELELEFVTGQRVLIRGAGAVVELSGKAKYVEPFQP